MRALGLRLGSGFLSEPDEKEGKAKDGPTNLPQGVGDFSRPHPPRETLDLPTANHGSSLDLVHGTSQKMMFNTFFIVSHYFIKVNG